MGQVTFSPVVLARLKRANGSNNIKIRVTYKRSYKLVSTTLYAMPADLDKHGCLKNNNLKFQAGKMINDMESALASIPFYELEQMDVAQVVRRITDILGMDTFRLDFFEHGRAMTARQKPGTAVHYTNALANFSRYLGKERLDINEITGDMLRDYADWLASADTFRGRPRQKGFGQRQMQYLSTIFNDAAKRYNDEENDIRRIKRKPFANIETYALPGRGQSSLKVADIQALIDYTPRTAPQRLAVDLFLTSFALMGMNMADIMSCPAPQNGVLTYNRAKTRDRRADRAEMVIPIPDYIKARVRPYERTDGRGWLNLPYKNTNSLNCGVNESLGAVARQLGIPKFSFYAARHSFATIARSKLCGIDKATVDECLCHVGDYKVADIYIEKDWEVLWDARDKVMGLFDWNKKGGE